MSFIGLRVGPFEITSPATVPGEGEWYLARRAGMTRRQPEEVLVRVLPEDADGGQRAELQAAFHNLRAVEDPRIPSAVALYEGVGALAIAVPDGSSLEDVVNERAKGTIALTPSTLLDIAIELAETLQHAHHRNRYHGHFEPGMVRITDTGKLFIFGFENPRARPSDTWLSPEHARGEAVSAATDQWGLAAVMAGLIGGRTPWTEGAAIDGDTRHLINPIEGQWPALARLIRRMLEPSVANRYPSMHPVRQELLALSRKAKGTSERLELGKAMARRTGVTQRSSASDPSIANTEVSPSVASPTTADTLVAPRVQADDPAMELPEPGLEPPPVVTRVEATERPPTPLPDEPIDVVSPDLPEQDEPSVAEEPSEPVVSAADTPSVGETAFDAQPLAELPRATDDVPQVEPMDSSPPDMGVPSDAPGEAPTAVPITDPGDPSEPPPPPDAPPPDDSPSPDLPEPVASLPDEPVDAFDDEPVPSLPDEPIDAVDFDPFDLPSVDEPVPLSEPVASSAPAVDIQKVVPVLVGLMVVLMLVAWWVS